MISSFEVLAIHLEKMKVDVQHMAISIIVGINRNVFKSPGISLRTGVLIFKLDEKSENLRLYKSRASIIKAIRTLRNT